MFPLHQPLKPCVTFLRSIIIWYGGKLHKVSVVDGAETLIPFSAHVNREVSIPVRPHHRIQDGPIHVSAVRWPSVLPNGKQLVFSAIGHLWITPSPEGEPKRLTQSDDYEYAPALSRDGKQIAYVSFAALPGGIRIGRGRLMVLRLGTERPEEILSEDGVRYYLPSWSPDGQKLAVVRERGAASATEATFGWVALPNPPFPAVPPAFPST